MTTDNFQLIATTARELRTEAATYTLLDAYARNECATYPVDSALFLELWPDGQVPGFVLTRHQQLNAVEHTHTVAYAEVEPQSTRWIDVLPALPLAIGLPVIIHWSDDTEKQTVIAVDDGGGGQTIDRNDWDPRGYVFTGGPDGCRVDLDDPQGMAYAIRIAVSRGVPPAFLPINAWVRGETTDADRLALAHALTTKAEGGEE